MFYLATIVIKQLEGITPIANIVIMHYFTFKNFNQSYDSSE